MQTVPVPGYRAVGFDLLTALLDSIPLWSAVGGSWEIGLRWHAASQKLLRGRSYRPYEDVLRDAAAEAGLTPAKADDLVARWDELAPWSDTSGILAGLRVDERFIVTNCSRELGERAAARLGAFALVMTAEEAGAFKPDARPYRLALSTLGLDPGDVLFVAGSAHDVGGARRAGMDVYWANRHGAATPEDGSRPLIEAPDLSRIGELLKMRG